MKNKVNEIKKCEVCGNDNLVNVLNLGHHPMCDDLVPIYLLLMGNTMKLENKKNLAYVFDLKGSMVNREVFVNK